MERGIVVAKFADNKTEIIIDDKFNQFLRLAK
jgi:hypothetical protein